MLRCWLVFGLLAAATATLSSAQNINDRDYNLTVDVELVQLPVSVLDKHGLPVRGLQQEHFTIYEDKVQQDITLFKQEDIPLSIGLVIDASGSMTDKLERLQTSAMTFVRESNPDDETSIVSFADEVNLVQDFTRNQRKLSRALAGITPSGNTSLYDAVFLAAEHLNAQSFHEKKVLLVVSDGEDNKSKYKLKEVLSAIQESKIILYTVGLLSPNPVFYTYTTDGGKKALKKLAEATGGASFFPKNVNQVEEICKKIARDLREQYTIGYKPSNDKLDGTWRKVQVRVNPPKTVSNIKVRSKQGYYAPSRRDAREPGAAKQTPRSPRASLALEDSD
jgi:Ca-activated chloride channel family protein